MDFATPYDRLRDFIDRMATIGDKPEDDEDLRVRKHALAITVLGLIPASVLWALIGLLIDRPLLTASSIYFSLAMPVMLVCLARTKAFEPIVRVLLVIGLSYVVLGHLALGGMSAGGASLIWGLVAPVSAVLYFDRGSSLRWFVGFGAIVVGAIVFDPLVVSVLPASWSSPPSWLFAYNLLWPVADRAAADPLRRRPAADGAARVAAPAARHAAGQDRRAAGGWRAADRRDAPGRQRPVRRRGGLHPVRRPRGGR